MTARKANRNGVLAYENAPPRLRASQIERPTVIEQPRSFWRWPFGKGTR